VFTSEIGSGGCDHLGLRILHNVRRRKSNKARHKVYAVNRNSSHLIAASWEEAYTKVFKCSSLICADLVLLSTRARWLSSSRRDGVGWPPRVVMLSARRSPDERGRLRSQRCCRTHSGSS
jgi:hypothetical protein